MGRLLAWISGLAGGLAAYRLLRRRRRGAEPAPAGETDPRAEALRAKLEQEAEPGPEAPEAAGEDPDARRRHVHEQARASIDEMRGR